MNTVTRAAIVATTRTGSGWLISLLDSHPQIRFHGELFNLERAPVAALADPVGYLDTALADDGTHRVHGFKMLSHHARLPYLNDFLDEMDEGRAAQVDWRTHFPIRPVTADQVPQLATTWEAIRDRGRTSIIHLRRRNLLRQHLSHQLLMAGSRARWRGGAPPVSPSVALPPARMLEAFAQTIAAAAEIDRFFASNPLLDVAYEDLAADCAAQCDRILRFLDLPVLPLHAASRPRPRPELRAAICNYDEIAAALSGTDWSSFLDDR